MFGGKWWHLHKQKPEQECGTEEIAERRGNLN